MEVPGRFELERWESEFAANSARLLSLASRFPGDQGSQRHFEGAWSVAECIKHLTITAQAFIPVWARACTLTDHSFGAPYPFWWRWLFAGINDPSKMRSSTPGAFVPSSALHLEHELALYLKERKIVKQLANEMYIGDIGGIKIASPFVSWMKYPLDFSFDLWIAHERRHLTQAEKG